MNDIEIDYSSLVQVYQKKITELMQQNVLLETRGNILAQTVNSLREKITELEETKSTGTGKKKAVNTATEEDFT
jgi:hypothetical protein